MKTLTKTDNELIAEFMGIGTDKIMPISFLRVYDHPVYGETNYTGLHYRTSWDWLMPVVEKIAQHVYETIEENNGYKNVTHTDRAYPRTFAMLDNNGKWMVRINRMSLEQESTLIEATYKAVVEWIKQQKP